jgi:hypothetical protein
MQISWRTLRPSVTRSDWSFRILGAYIRSNNRNTIQMFESNQHAIAVCFHEELRASHRTVGAIQLSDHEFKLAKVTTSPYFVVSGSPNALFCKPKHDLRC